MAYDKHHGQAGTFVVGTDGKRSPVSPDKDGNVQIGDKLYHRPQTKPHEEGDAPRDANGERVDRGADQQAAAKPQPAMPEAAATPPWAPRSEAPASSSATRQPAPEQKAGMPDDQKKGK